MKKGKLLFGALAAAAGVMYLIAPEKPDETKAAPFKGRNFAHRGLHTKDGITPENSLPAFEAAATLGYGVELDVHLTADDQVVVFHDNTLERMCGVPGKIEDMFYTELSKLGLGATNNKIPLLSEVLEVLGGVPIVLEIKKGSRNAMLCALTLEQIRKYPGPVCVESFDPRIVGWFRKNAPELLRGQLSSAKLDGVSKPLGFALSRLMLNVVSRPNFIAYGIGKKPVLVRVCEKMGAMKVAWTSHDEKAEKKNDSVIFEHYLPAVRFK